MDISGANVASQLVLESRNTVEKLQPQVQEFEQVLAQMSAKGQDPGSLLQSAGGESPLKVDDVGQDALYAEKLRQAQEPGGVEKLLGDLQSDWKRMEDIVDQMMSGETLSIQELFAIQVEAHNISLNVEMGAKAIEKVVHAAQELFRQNL